MSVRVVPYRSGGFEVDIRLRLPNGLRHRERRVVSNLSKSAAKQNGVHRLRHTFCSHLAMRGAPTRAIQELAGHKDLSTTQRYMHLSISRTAGGDNGETGSTEITNSSR